MVMVFFFGGGGASREHGLSLTGQPLVQYGSSSDGKTPPLISMVLSVLTAIYLT